MIIWQVHTKFVLGDGAYPEEYKGVDQFLKLHIGDTIYESEVISGNITIKGVLIRGVSASFRRYCTIVGYYDEAGTGTPMTTDIAAVDVTYDNSISGISATDVQGAIDEIAGSSGGGYIPGDPTQWNVPAPITTKNALDRLVVFINNHVGSTLKP